MQTSTTPALVSLPPMEIFRAGDYGAKGVFTNADLALIASGYSADKHEAPVTTDHDKTGPAHGWVKRVTAKGDKLFAEAEVTAEFADAVRDRKFIKRSVELYGDAEFADGKPYLKRLTFLGAKIPHVKGMPDPEFSEAGEKDTEISFDEPEGCFFTAKFAEEPAPPSDASFGVIVRQYETYTNLEHFHRMYVDDQGNGYTGPPMKYNEDWDIVPSGADMHQHTVEGGKVQASATTWGVQHTHGDFDFEEPTKAPRKGGGSNSGGKIPPTGELKMSTATEAPKASEKPDVDFAEEIAARDARIAKLEKDAADREFSESFARAAKKIAPGSLKPAAAIFAELSRVKADVEFDEGDGKTSKLSLPDAFLKFMEGLEPAPATGSVVDGNEALTREPASFDEGERTAKEFAEAEELVKTDGISFEEAAAKIRSARK